MLVIFEMSLPSCCGVVCLCWWLGGNCYHRRCVAACRRRVGGLWSQNPRVVAQSAVDLGGMRVTWGFWGVVDDGLGALVRREVFLWCGVSGTSGLSACCRDDRAHCRRLSRGAAREGGASWCVLVTYFCAAAGEVLPRMVRLFCGGIGWVSCARVLVCSCARVLVCSCARVLVCSLGPSTALSERESRCSLSPNAESVHVGAIHVGRCFLAAAFMRRGGVVVSFVRRPEQARNSSRIE